MNITEGGIVVKVQKWGNSLGLRIPVALAKQINIEEGTEVTMSVESNQVLLVKPVDKKPTLDELVSKITPENRHQEIDVGIEGNERI